MSSQLGTLARLLRRFDAVVRSPVTGSSTTGPVT